MSEHSKIGASSMSRWQKCPGSVRLSEGIEGTTSIHAAEGTVAHGIAEFSLRKPFEPITPNIGAVVTQDGYDIKVTKEMLDAVAVYTEFVDSEMNSENAELVVEQRFHLKEVHPDLFGTADAVIYQPANKKLLVCDYKHGAGVPVEVEGNVQLMYYAVGAAMERNFKGITEVEIVVVQPRCDHPDGPIRRWTIDAFTLMDWMEVLRSAAFATDDPDAPVISGSWCRWCKAKGVCPTLEKEALSAASVDFETIKGDPDKLAEALSKVDAVDAWVKAVRAHAYQEATHGREPTGWKLVEKRPVRHWDSIDKAVEFLSLYGMDDTDIYQERKIKTPPQIEKIVGKKNAKDIAILIIKKSSGTTLVPNADKREPVKAGPDSDFEKLDS